MNKRTNSLISSTSFILAILLVVIALFFESFPSSRSNVKGHVEKIDTVSISNEESDGVEIIYDAIVENTLETTIRICGGQLNWCSQDGCFSVTTELPLFIEPKKQKIITIVITPRNKSVSATKMTLFADGEGLEGLTPIIITLPAVSSPNQ